MSSTLFKTLLETASMQARDGPSWSDSEYDADFQAQVMIAAMVHVRDLFSKSLEVYRTVNAEIEKIREGK